MRTNEDIQTPTYCRHWTQWILHTRNIAPHEFQQHLDDDTHSIPVFLFRSLVMGTSPSMTLDIYDRFFEIFKVSRNCFAHWHILQFQ